jgi:hypothetical protein
VRGKPTRLEVTALAIGAALLLAAAAAPSRVADWTYTGRVSGIPVSDSSGTPMAAPFLGGFDVPRPQLVDMNGDGRPDLFVQERTGELMHFERTGDGWAWKSDRFQALDVGDWFRFVDIDRDGDADLFGEMLTGYIRVWQNTGSRAMPKFVALGDTVRDVDGRAIVADRQNILNAVDIDCNGKLDLFIGRVQGVLDRYEQEGVSPDGSPRFRMLDEGWQGIEVLGPEQTGGSLQRTDTLSFEGAARPGPRIVERRHGANTLTFADIGGRGTLDLFWGDFFEEGLLRFENGGSCAHPDFSSPPARFPVTKPVLTSGYNAPTFGDVDGDGNIDLVLGAIGGAFEPSRTSIDNLYLVQQRPKDSWTVTTRRLITTIDVGSDAAPALADVNGDRLLDLVIGDKLAPNDASTGTVTWYANVGTVTAPSFRERGRLPVRGEYNYAPAIADLDGDSLPDLVVGTWRDRLQWYRNSGTRSAPVWTLADTALVTITRGTNSTPSFGDLDGDGLVDLMIGEASGTLNYYRNRGTRVSPKFELVSDAFQAIKVGRRSAPVLVDMDADGTLDLLVGDGNGDITLWRGIRGSAGGTPRFERDSSFAVRSHPHAVPAVGDLHGTGRLDLLVGTAAGGVRWFERGKASSARE